jgi:hypothetical protein
LEATVRETARQEYACLADAEAAAAKVRAVQSAYHRVQGLVEERPQYGSGRPNQTRPHVVKALRYGLQVTRHERVEVIARNWRAPLKRTNSITPLARRDKQGKAGKRHWDPGRVGTARSASLAWATTTKSSQGSSRESADRALSWSMRQGLHRLEGAEGSELGDPRR